MSGTSEIDLAVASSCVTVGAGTLSLCMCRIRKALGEAGATPVPILVMPLW